MIFDAFGPTYHVRQFLLYKIFGSHFGPTLKSDIINGRSLAIIVAECVCYIYPQHNQGWQKVLKYEGANRNVVGIICPPRLNWG